MPKYREMIIIKYQSSDGLKHLFRKSGIYLLIHMGQVDYIGRSRNIGNRLTSHHIFDRTYHDQIGVLEIPFKDSYKMRKTEIDLIHLINPPKNITGTYRQSIMQTGKKLHRTNRNQQSCIAE